VSAARVDRQKLRCTSTARVSIRTRVGRGFSIVYRRPPWNADKLKKRRTSETRGPVSRASHGRGLKKRRRSFVPFSDRLTTFFCSSDRIPLVVGKERTREKKKKFFFSPVPRVRCCRKQYVLSRKHNGIRSVCLYGFYRLVLSARVFFSSVFLLLLFIIFFFRRGHCVMSRKHARTLFGYITYSYAHTRVHIYISTAVNGFTTVRAMSCIYVYVRTWI